MGWKGLSAMFFSFLVAMVLSKKSCSNAELPCSTRIHIVYIGCHKVQNDQASLAEWSWNITAGEGLGVRAQQGIRLYVQFFVVFFGFF